MKIIEKEVKSYGLVYEDVNRSGYSFPCDREGNILWEKISSPTAAKKNLAYCKEHQEKWNVCGEVVTYTSRSRYGICPFCGSKVYFDGSGYFGAFECECGKWYNRFGQELKNPKSWDWDDDYDDYNDLYKDDSYKYWYEYCYDEYDDESDAD